MTRARQPKPTAPPLAVTLRAALAQGWHTLDALEPLAGRATGARLRVHAALAELRAGGAALEERVERGVAEVRLGVATLPAPRPDDGDDMLDADDREAARVALEQAAWERDGTDEEHAAACGPRIVPSAETMATVRALVACPKCSEVHYEGEHCLRFALLGGTAAAREWVDLTGAEPAPAPDAPAPPVGQAAPVEAVEGPAAPERATLCAGSGHGAGCGNPLPCKYHPSALDAARAAVASKGPGPSSRCAVCSSTFAKHAPADGHTFAAKRHGGKRAPGHPAYHARQRTRADVLDALTDPYRVEVDPALATYESMREAAAREVAAKRAAGAESETSRGESEASALYSAIKTAGPTRVTLADGSAGNASAVPVYMATPDAASEDEDESPKRHRFWHPRHGLGWLTWGEVLPSTPTRFEPDDGQPFEWIWTQCGWGRPDKREPRREGPAMVEWRAWEYFKTDTGETFVFRRGGPPPLNLDTRGPPTEVERRAVARVEEVVRAEMGRCRPPLCHRDDIHDPARVRSFARPLCDGCRGWVVGAGGTVAPACDVVAMGGT